VDIDTLSRTFREHPCVKSIHIDLDNRTLKYNLLLTMIDNEEMTKSELIVYFYDIHELNLMEFGGGLSQFIHLSIMKLSQQNDRVRFKVTEKEHSSVAFLCADFEVF
jgi:hypothetical protein